MIPDPDGHRFDGACTLAMHLAGDHAVAASYELSSLAPNLIVADVERSIAFYRDVLGFSVVTTVPDASPYVFASVKSGSVEVLFNAPGPAVEEYPVFKERPIGGTLTLFIRIAGIRAACDTLKSRCVHRSGRLRHHLRGTGAVESGS